MELKLLNANGQEGAAVNASDVVFGRDYNEALIHQIVVAYQANARSGNRAQKDREQVKHTTKKPWRQKVRAVLVPVCRQARCGVAVVASSRIRRKKIFRTRSTRRCIAQVSARSSRSWPAKAASRLSTS